MPVFYECQRCTACCRWPGQVRISDAEISSIAALMNLPEDVFIQRYTRLNRDRSGLALMDKSNGECVFLDGANCSIQSAKPQQCRDFPNLWRFPGFDDSCRATPREVNQEEYRKLVSQATGRSESDIDPSLPTGLK